MLTTHDYGGVTQIRMSRYPDPMPGTSVSAYLVDGLLVDTGLAYTAGELADFIAERQLHTIVNTHYHEDHMGGNALVCERTGVKPLAHQLALRKMTERPTLYPYQEDFWGYPKPCEAEAIGETVSTTRYRFEVIHTPGHSPDHICLYERVQGWLFTGDLFISKHPRVARLEEDQRQIITSLGLIRELKPRLLFTAPANAVTEPDKVLGEMIRYLEELGGKIAELRTRFTPEETARKLFGEDSYITGITQGQFSSLNLVLGFGK